MKKILLLLPFIFSTALAHECIPYSAMTGFEVTSSSSLIVYTSGARDFNVTTGVCLGLWDAQRIGFRSFSSFQVCDTDRLLVIDAFTGAVTDTCWIDHITIR